MRRLRPAVEGLERRSLLAAFEVTGGLAAYAAVDGQSQRDFRPTSGLSEATASIGGDPFGGYNVSTASSLARANLLGDYLSLGLSATADYDNDHRATVSLDSHAGTSQDGSPGEWVNIRIAPTGNERVGDPVDLAIHGSAAARPDNLGLSHYGVQTRFEAKVDIGQGPQTLLDDGIPSGIVTTSAQGSTNVAFGLRIGDTFSVYMDLYVRDIVSVDGTDGGTGHIDLTFRLNPSSTPPPLPDIRAASARQDSPTSVVFGYEVHGSPGPFQVGLYRSADATFDPRADVRVGEPSTITPSPNGSGVATLTLPGPLPIDPNLPNLLVVADPNGLINESDESNNVAASSPPPTDSLPDIRVVSARIVARRADASEVAFNYAVAGNPGDVRFGLYLASGTSLDVDHDRLITQQVLTPSPGSTREATFSLPISFAPETLAAFPHFLVVADPPTRALPDGVIAESIESNNQLPVDTAFSPEIIPFIEDNLGWHVAARLLRTWFADPRRRSAEGDNGPDLSVPTVPIDLAWVRGFPRGRDQFNSLIRLFENLPRDQSHRGLNARRALQAKVLRVMGSGTRHVVIPLTDRPVSSGDLATPDFHTRNQLTFERSSANIFGDDLQAGLGNFALYAAPIGTASRRGNRVVVQIKKIAVYVRDSFDFNGSQSLEALIRLVGGPLGCWAYPNVFRPVQVPISLTPVDNQAFRAFREDTGRGGDFQVFSTIQVQALRRPITLTFPSK